MPIRDIDAETIEEIDMSEVNDLEEQKNYCNRMLRALELEEKKLKKRFIGTKTINDFLESDAAFLTEVGQYVGYSYGSINQCMILVDSALVNLKKFESGEFDTVDKSARSMFLSLWYNLGISTIDSMNHMMRELEGLEQELLQRIVETAEDGDIILKRGSIH